MAVLEIIKHPNEVLETPCERVINFDKKLGLFYLLSFLLDNKCDKIKYV